MLTYLLRGFEWLGNFFSALITTECRKIYRISVMYLPKSIFAVYFSRCSTDLQNTYEDAVQICGILKQM